MDTRNPSIKLIDSTYNFGRDGIAPQQKPTMLIRGILLGLCIGLIPFGYNLAHKEVKPLTEAHKAQIAIEWLTQYDAQKTSPSTPVIKPAGIK